MSNQKYPRGVVFAEWDKFRQRVIKNNPPPGVVLLMQMGFYGGVSYYERLLANLSPGPEPTAEDLQLLRDIRKECIAFAQSLTPEDFLW
jgi:hypothetical protein